MPSKVTVADEGGKKSSSTQEQRELKEFKSFPHGLEILVNDREDRCFRASKIYIQGLPLNPGQAMEVARDVCDIHGLPVAETTFSDLGRHIKALNNKGIPSKGESAIPMIGSTSLSHAVVLDLSRTMDFSASPAVGSTIPTVMEVVVRTTPDMKQEAAPTTITIVPWIIEETADLALYFRFHHMALDAKPDIVHSIYQQLSIGSNEQSDPIQQLQFIVRIITAEKPMWVIDIVGPVGIPNIPAMNRHLTGNAAGDCKVFW